MKRTSALNKRLGELEKSIRRSAEAGMEEGIAQIVREAKALCPVETGELKDSIRGEVRAQGNRVEGRIWAAPYAMDVDQGRGDYGSPHPFLSPAYQRGKQSLIKSIMKGIREGR